MLTVTEARRRYGSVQALDGCSLAVAPREWVGLLGPNGAGKTSLIRAISGRVRLDAGRIELFGTEIGVDRRRDLEVHHRMGVVPQEIALYPTLTAQENLEVFASLLGLAGTTRRDRVSWALAFTGLQDRARHLVRTFSGGMKRRLNIACGVLHKPELVLLDEPTVGVDPQSRQRIWEMLAELQADGTALLLTTHQLDEAQQLCERIVIIDHGRTIASGTLRELLTATVGRHHEVTIRLDAPPSDGLAPGDWRVERTTMVGHVENVGVDLPAMLARIQAAGRSVEDVHLASPTLHSVFIALTGRELRE
ncbi:MAG: ABC transporter ATP-binding protein [Phycisphaerales bacterium]|nr:ABC transporter ATP-binding protein [Phycisphaerales bacterium]